MTALCVALSVVSVYAVGVTLLWRSSAASVSDLMARLIRSQGQFAACDAELNRTKVDLTKALLRVQGRK